MVSQFRVILEISSTHLLSSWCDSIHFISLSRNSSVMDETMTMDGEHLRTCSSSFSSMRVTSWYAVNALETFTLDKMSLLSSKSRLHREPIAYGFTSFHPSTQTTSSSN